MNFYLKLLLGVFFLTVNETNAYKTTFNEVKTTNTYESLSQATIKISTALLQNKQLNSDANLLWSPFGFSTLLGLLREGSDGETGSEIDRALNLTSNESLRDAYTDILTEFLNEKDPNNGPQFKTWFYVYQNNTIKKNYRRILEQNYRVEVKDVERFDYEFKEDEKVDETSTDFPELTLTLDGDIADLDTFKKDETLGEFEDKNSKFDKHVDDSQYVDFEKNSVTSKLKRMVKTSRSMNDRNDVASALSGNSLMGDKTSEKPDAEKTETESKMLVFNGLYYRGKWGTPFKVVDSSEGSVFVTSTGKENPVTTISTEGFFKYGSFDEHQFEAVLLPYENIRYNLLLVSPTSSNESSEFFTKFDAEILSEILPELELTSLKVTVPVFEADTLCHAEEAFQQIGIKKLFTKEADFNLITEDQNLHVQELVQHVVFSMDLESSSHNALTAHSILGRSKMKNFTINRPFMFFLLDIDRNIIIVGGKLNDITSERKEF